MVDAGAEHRGYATADITRTFPSGGKFDAMRRDIYEAVLDVQNASIKEMIPNTNYRLVQELAKTRTAQRLIDLGLVNGRAEDAAFAGVASLFMPHALGHLLGLQVHDVEAGRARAGRRAGARRDVRAGHILRGRPARPRLRGPARGGSF